MKTSLQQKYIEIENQRKSLKQQRWDIESRIIETTCPLKIGDVVTLVNRPDLGTFEVFEIKVLYFKEFGFKYFLELGESELDNDQNAKIHYDRMDECLEGKYIEDLIIEAIYNE